MPLPRRIFGNVCQHNFTEEGKYFMVRCYKCERENYLPAVYTGNCGWCGEQGSAAKELDYKVGLLAAHLSQNNHETPQIE